MSIAKAFLVIGFVALSSGWGGAAFAKSDNNFSSEEFDREHQINLFMECNSFFGQECLKVKMRVLSELGCSFTHIFYDAGRTDPATRCKAHSENCIMPTRSRTCPEGYELVRNDQGLRSSILNPIKRAWNYERPFFVSDQIEVLCRKSENSSPR